MNYLIAYFLLGLFVIPFYAAWEKDWKKVIKIILFGFPLWPFVFALRIHAGIRMNYYSTRCAFCGEEWEDVTREGRDQAIRDHIKVCEKHPFRVELEGWRKKNRALAKKNTDLQMKYLLALQDEQWKPVEERLPEEKKVFLAGFLVLMKNTIPLIAFFDYAKKYFYCYVDGGQVFVIEDVTHWKEIKLPIEKIKLPKDVLDEK